MGLDQYLTTKIYIGAEYEHRNITGTIKLFKNGKPIKINLKQVSYIEERVGYWRKANAIHNWIVGNVQDGQDNCEEYYFNLEQIEQLYNICVKIKNNHSLAMRILPVCNGFFFGSTKYDEYYFDDIELTIKILKPLLNSGNDIYYRSSW